MESCSPSMEDEHKVSGKSPPLNFQIFPISSTPFNFIHSKQPSTSKPSFHLLVGPSNVVREAHKSIASNVDKILKMVDTIKSQNGVLEKLMSFSTYLQNCCQVWYYFLPLFIKVQRISEMGFILCVI